MRPLLVAIAVPLIMVGSAMLLGPSEPAPPLPPELIDDGTWLLQAEQISHLRLPLYVAGLVLPPTALWIFVRRGAAARLRRRLIERGLRRRWLLVPIFTLILTAGLALLQLPIDLAGYIVRRNFGLSPETPDAWLLRHLAEWGVGALLSLIAVSGLYWLLHRFPRRWWLIASLGYVLLSLALVYLQPLVITPLFFQQRPLADPALRARIVQMGAHIDLPVDEVFVIDASKQGNEGNAYFTGIGDTTRIVLYDTLVRSYPPDELLAIVGHEMGHWRERHVWKALILSWVLAPVCLLATHLLLRSLLPRWGIRTADDVAGLPFLLLLLSLFSLVTLPIGNWQSRRWEATADRLALEATGDPTAQAQAFVRLGRQNLSDPTPHPLVEALFATHPPLGRRVAALPRQTTGP